MDDDSVFRALADASRRQLLDRLHQANGQTLGELCDGLRMTRQAVSKHLAILTECELLSQEQNGREIYYHINATKMREVADFIEPFRKMWDDRFNKIEAIMKKYKTK